MVVGVMRRAASTAEGDMQCGEKRAVSARRILGSVVVIHATFPTLRSRPDYVDASLSSARSGAVHRSPPGRVGGRPVCRRDRVSSPSCVLRIWGLGGDLFVYAYIRDTNTARSLPSRHKRNDGQATPISDPSPPPPVGSPEPIRALTQRDLIALQQEHIVVQTIARVLELLQMPSPILSGEDPAGIVLLAAPRLWLPDLAGKSVVIQDGIDGRY